MTILLHIVWAFLSIVDPLLFTNSFQDISADNIVINIVGSREKSWRSSQKHPTTYYFIDFELAIRFDPRSDQKPWVVSGLPMEGFQRVAAPEVRGLIPYCPFKADVYALGFIYYEYFRVSRLQSVP